MAIALIQNKQDFVSQFQEFNPEIRTINFEVKTEAGATKIQNIDTIKLELIKQEAIEEGKKIAKKEITTEIFKVLDEYFGLVTKITEFVIKKSNIVISETRTNFCEDRTIKILFIINDGYEKELDFVKLLAYAEAVTLENFNFISTLSFLNIKGKEDCINSDLLNLDYPYIYQRK